MEERGYRGSYSSVHRFVRHLRPVRVTPIVRVETAAEEGALIDFGTLGQVIDARTGEPILGARASAAVHSHLVCQP